MGATTTIATLSTRPLTTGDAGALQADILPASFWQPTMLLERNMEDAIDLASAGLGAAGDIWRVILSPPSAIDNVIFYPIAFRFTLKARGATPPAGFPALFETAASFCVEGPTNYNWDTVTLDAAQSLFDSPSTIYWNQNGNPRWHAFPPKPILADSTSVASNAVGGIQLTIDTWDATAAALVDLHVDARWLGFPRPVERSAGFYTPRMYFNPN
jgi:hypothetical protein